MLCFEKKFEGGAVLNLSFYMPTKIIGGSGAMQAAEHDIAGLGHCALIITGRSSAKRSGALADATALLDRLRIRYDIFNQITANPLLSSCEKAGQRARDIGADFLMAIGGGSVLDASKAAALYATNETVMGEAIYDLCFSHHGLPIVAVGITAGTGSEVTPYAVLTVDRTGQKRSITHRDCYPALAVADPIYTHSVDYDGTVSTALDALSHAVEGWFSPRANEITDSMARQAIPLLWNGLCELSALEDEKGISFSLRERLQTGSLLAGLVLNHCSTGFPHPLGYPLTEHFGIPHGKACAAFLPALARRGAEFLPHRGETLCAMLGDSLDSFEERIVSLAALSPLTISDDLLDDCYMRWQSCKNFHNSPGDFTREEAIELFKTRVSK